MVSFTSLRRLSAASASASARRPCCVLMAFILREGGTQALSAAHWPQ